MKVVFLKAVHIVSIQQQSKTLGFYFVLATRLSFALVIYVKYTTRLCFSEKMCVLNFSEVLQISLYFSQCVKNFTNYLRRPS